MIKGLSRPKLEAGLRQISVTSQLIFVGRGLTAKGHGKGQFQGGSDEKVC